MTTPPDKKPGRNEPCWCGSGKKYKHCHLRQDQAAAAAARVVSPWPRSRLAGPRPTGEPQKAIEPMPEEAAAQAEWDQYEAADLEGKTAIFLQRVDEGRLDGEDVFEMLLSIREVSKPHEDEAARVQFRTLVERLKGALPEVYREERGFILESLILDAVADQDWGRIAGPLAELATIADRRSEEFFRVMQALAYHGQTQTLIEAIKLAWSTVRGSSDVTRRSVQEFSGTLLELNLFRYLDTTSHALEDDPALSEALPDGVAYDRVWLSRAMRYLSAAGPRVWLRADFGETVDADTWEENVAGLLLDFMAEQRRAGHVPLSRSNMMREIMREVLHEQLARPAPACHGAKRARV